MNQAHRFRIVFAAFVAALAASVPLPLQAIQTSGPTGSGSPRPAGGGMDFSFAAEIGRLGGTASELVFDYPFGSKTKISELTWDLKDVTVAGVRASARLGARFRLHAGFWSALDEGSGDMVDRDWLYTDESFLELTPDEGNWTHESRHPETSVDEGTMFDVNLSVLAFESGAFSLSGVLGYKRDSWSWSSRGGTFVYSDEDFRDLSGDFEDLFGKDVLVIEYEQTYSIPYLGVSLSWAAPTFSFEGHALYSPAVSATDRDYHALRERLFEGDFSGGTYVGLGLNAAWTFAPQWFASLGLEYQSVLEMTGDVTVTSPEVRGTYGDSGGVAMDATMITLGAGYRF
jgi:outer membrane protease